MDELLNNKSGVSRKTILKGGAASQMAIHEFIVNAFDESGESQSEIARRMGIKREQVSRWLSAPLNMRVGTAGKLYAAITGKNWKPVDCGMPSSKPRNLDGIEVAVQAHTVRTASTNGVVFSSSERSATGQTTSVGSNIKRIPVLEPAE